MTSFSPLHIIGNQIMEAILLHQNVNKKEARALAIDMLDKVGIPNPQRRIDEYPHQLSGGMRQRGMQEEFNLTYLFITHDLSVIEHISDRVTAIFILAVGTPGTHLPHSEAD